MTIMHRGAICWQRAQPGVLALLLGLILGPIISNNLGWQMASGAARAAERAAIVEQAAMICEQRARDDVTLPGQLDRNERSELAKKWSVVVKGQGVDADVIGACSRKLAS
jgi:hypothetical protein